MNSLRIDATTSGYSFEKSTAVSKTRKTTQRANNNVLMINDRSYSAQLRTASVVMVLGAMLFSAYAVLHTGISFVG